MAQLTTRGNQTLRGEEATIEWLLEGDAAIRWQVMRDLEGRPAGEVARERTRVATEGWGARLLAEQAEDGSWGGGLYSPKWTSTFYTLLLLTAMGLPRHNRQAVKAAELLLAKGRALDGGFRYRGGPGSPPWQPTVGELCVTGMGLRMLATYLPDPAGAAPAVECLLRAQLDDGGWNCERRSRHGSFHTTISALEGLAAWSTATGGGPEVDAAAVRGQEFFLTHRMFRSHRTGEVAKASFTRFTFPYHWHYDVLRGLDYLQSVGAPRDERLTDAIDLLRAKERHDGRWPNQGHHAGREYFRLEEGREGSRWNTLRALRVLRWWGA